MVQEFINAMTAVLLAKFVLNDIPHAIMGSPESKQDKIVRELKESVLEQIRWKSTKDAEGLWGRESESSWVRDKWGKVEGGMVTLFHGTDPINIPDILREGLKLGYWVPPEELEEGEEPQKGLWLTVTPYYAFFYGDACVRVHIPIEWIDSVMGDEVWLDRGIPPEMIVEVKSIEDWRREG